LKQAVTCTIELNFEKKIAFEACYIEFCRMNEQFISFIGTAGEGHCSLFLPVAYNGVFVSLKPRKTPCMASDSSTAGAPSDLIVR